MKRLRLRLGVNIDHVATIRQARGTSYPDPLDAARICARAGADGITVHLREDRRHIRESDVYGLRKALPVPLNLEMAVVPEIIRIALDVRPHEVCLVPERRQELTTEGGLDVAARRRSVAAAVRRLSGAGIAVSLFIDPDEKQIRAAAAVGAPLIELHTGTYCTAADRAGGATEARHELDRLARGAALAHQLGLKVNAGHGLNLHNLGGLLRQVHTLHTLNIGHSIVARAVLVGMDKAVREMIRAMSVYRG